MASVLDHFYESRDVRKTRDGFLPEELETMFTYVIKHIKCVVRWQPGILF